MLNNNSFELIAASAEVGNKAARLNTEHDGSRADFNPDLNHDY